MSILKKINTILIITVLACSGTVMASATIKIKETSINQISQNEILNCVNIQLPTDQVTMNLASNGVTSYFLVTLSNVPSGYDVTNDNYIGWCGDPDTYINRYIPHQVYLHLSCDNDLLPLYLQNDEWDKVNYIINHKQGNPNTWNYFWEIQFAIWYILGYGDRGMEFIGQPMNPTAWAMVNDSIANGEGYIPSAGEVIAIIADSGPDTQEIIFEITIPEIYEGLTPGFWKNHQNLWYTYTPDQTLYSVFPLSIILVGSKTFIQALDFHGGPFIFGAARILLRHAVAAILNAAHINVNYPFSENEIIEQVNNALQSMNRDTMLYLANTLDIYNNLGCEDL